MNVRSMPPLWKASLETDRATDAMSGKIDRNRMTMTVGQMKTQRAAPSERQAPSEVVARRMARARRAGPSWIGPPGSVSMTLSLDAKAGDVGSELLVLPGLVGDAIPAVRDRLFRAGFIELTGEVLGEGRVQNVLLIALRQRDPHVEHHVRTLEAGLDGVKVIGGRGVAQSGGLPGREIREVRRPIRVVAGLAERHVHTRLGGCAHVRQEGEGSILLCLWGCGVDGSRPATERCERGVVHAVDRLRAGRAVARDELAGAAIEDFLPTGRDRRARLVLGIGARGQGPDVAPVHR